MADFIEYASKAQEELNAQLRAISEKELRLAEKASILASREVDLDSRRSGLAEAEKAMDEKKAQLSFWESQKIREEEVSRLHGEALGKEVASQKRLVEADEKLAETRYNLADLAKRELALSEKEKTYREEIKKEMMNTFLGVR